MKENKQRLILKAIDHGDMSAQEIDTFPESSGSLNDS
jgi:hypothetical protein